MSQYFSVDALYDQLGLHDAPFVIDVRSRAEKDAVPRMIPGASRVDAIDASDSLRHLALERAVVLYGGNDTEALANALASKGHTVLVLEGGLHAWLARSLPTIRIREELGVPGRSQWVTRERPKIDRLACPWLVRRFIDPSATFFYVPASNVRSEASALGAQPFDIADVTFSHRGPKCSFDAFLEEFDLRDPILDQVANIVRAADTGALEQSRHAPGLLAISLGMSAAIQDDLVLLEQAMPVYDALYTWCKKARDESHSWPQQAAYR